MARRRKRLVDLVRDGTFLARKDEHLLGHSERLHWRELERMRKRFRAADDESDRREIALELQRLMLDEHGARKLLGDLQAELAKLGPPGSLQRLEGMGRKFFRHYAGPKAGKPFRLDPYQREYVAEESRRDKHGRRIYQVALLMAPKGNGKTPLGALYGTEALVSNTDAPEVYNIAGAKDQAGFCFDFAAANIQDGPLAAWLDVGGATIRCDEHRGEYEIQSADGDLSAGVKPTKSVFDELFQFVHRKQREQWNSHAKALHKRVDASLQAFSTGGWDKATLLGEMYDAAIAHPKLEVRNNGALLVLRDEESGFLFWCYQAPEGADPEDVKAIRACNPASWIVPRDLVKEWHRQDTREADWLRLHFNWWTETKDSWLPMGIWAGLRSETEIPRGAEIFCGVDAALNYDTTALVWAARLEDGRILMQCRVWSARAEVPHHVYVPGGRIRNRLVMNYIRDELAPHYRVREVVGDSRFLNDLLPELSDEGFVVAEFAQNSGDMADAYQHLYETATAGTIAWHDPDAVFARHVDAAAAIATERGWKVYKLRSSQPIDCVPAGAMARERCMLAGRDVYTGGVEFWDDEEDED